MERCVVPLVSIHGCLTCASVVSVRDILTTIDISMKKKVPLIHIEYIQHVRLVGGDGKVDKQITCKHSQSSQHSYCSHNKTAQHDN